MLVLFWSNFTSRFENLDESTERQCEKCYAVRSFPRFMLIVYYMWIFSCVCEIIVEWGKTDTNQPTNYVINWLTLSSIVLLDKLMLSQPMKKFTALHKTRWFIGVRETTSTFYETSVRVSLEAQERKISRSSLF